MDLGTLLPRPRTSWKLSTIGVTILALFAMIGVSFVLWTSYFFATAWGMGLSWGKGKMIDGNGQRVLDYYDESPRLRFKPGGTFKIAVLEDLHFGEGEDNPPEWGWGPPSDLKSRKVIRTVLDAEKPNLVVINGDLITGENTHLHNATTYLDQIVEHMVKRQIPWASTYGNHDQQYNLSPTQLLLRERNLYPVLSLTRKMVSHPRAGVTNYVLPVFSANTSDPVPALLLWFFDSQGGCEFQKLDANNKTIGVPGFVHSSVAEWFETENTLLRKRYGRTIPSLAFVHIPIFAMNAFQSTGVGKNTEPGINDDNPLSPQAITNNTYTGDDIPFMSALVKTKGLKAIFSGHDHGDDWCAKWDKKLPGMTIAGSGIVMCFGRHTGYGGYGKWTRGSRQILLDERTWKGKEEVETWVRLEDDSISGRVTLNATYGKDRYPAVNNTFTRKLAS